MTSNIKKINSLKEIVDNYEYFIIDLWGVLHDGLAPYPYSVEALRNLRKYTSSLSNSGKKPRIILLSNAPRRSHKAKIVLQNLGFEDSFYDYLITSGEISYNFVKKQIDTGKYLKKKFYYIGPNKDLDIFDGLGLEATNDPAQADFVVATGFEGFGSIFAEKKPQLDLCLQHSLPLLCPNPDRKVVNQKGEEQICAGLMGEYYQEQGGEVEFFGKPYKAAYTACLEIFGIGDATATNRKILCIGDSLYTDIKGSKSIKADSLLTACGIFHDKICDKNGNIILENIEKTAESAEEIPNYVIDFLRY